MSLTYFPVGTLVRHEDGHYGHVVRVVASLSGKPLALIAWDDFSQTRGGDAVKAVLPR